MKDHYDFSQSIKNPYFKYLQESVTLQLKEDVLNYFTPLFAVLPTRDILPRL